jgi:hypothetical protein
MSPDSDRIRSAIQKLTEAIWNLEQLDPMALEVKEEYARIQLAREKLMKLVKHSKSEV